MLITEQLPPTSHAPAHCFGTYLVKHMIHLKPRSHLHLNYMPKKY